MGALLGNAPRSPEELWAVINKRDPKTGLPRQAWRVDFAALARDDTATTAVQQLRAHAKENFEEIKARFGTEATRLLSDEEWANRDADSDDDEPSDEEAAKENAGRNKPAAAKASAKPEKKPASKKRAALSESDDDGGGGSDEDDDFVKEKPRKANKRSKSAKKANKASKAAKPAAEEPFFAVVRSIVDLGLAAGEPLMLLIQSLGLVAGNAPEVRPSVAPAVRVRLRGVLTRRRPAQRAELLAVALACGGSAAAADEAAKAKCLLSSLKIKAGVRGIAVPDGLEPPKLPPAAEEEPEEAA